MTSHRPRVPRMHKNTLPAACAAALMLLLAACAPKQAPQPAAPTAPPAARPTAADAAAATTAPPEEHCTNEPRTDENDKRPRCGGMGAAAAPSAYHVVGGSGDPVDETVCDISQTFVLNGKLFGVEFSGGMDGTYKIVRTPNIPGLHWSAGGGRYHIEFPDGADKQGTLTTEGGGTITAGSQSRTTSGSEHFTLTPAAACEIKKQH